MNEAIYQQAMDKFKDVKLRDQLTLDQIYELRDIDDNEISADTKVSICTVQGLLKRTILAEKPDLMPGAFDLIIVDEAHHALSPSYQTILNQFPDAKVLGVTVTT